MHFTVVPTTATATTNATHSAAATATTTTAATTTAATATKSAHPTKRVDARGVQRVRAVRGQIQPARRGYLHVE